MNFEQYQVQEISAPTGGSDNEEVWKQPLFLAPRIEHTRTFIILHGRGDTAYPFGSTLATVRLPSSHLTLPEVFPEAKFIFPSSKPRDLAIMRGAKATQWFDMSSFKDPDERQELQYEGLRDSTIFIHDIIRQEASLVGLENVIIGGLSQGCALGIHVMMSYQGAQGKRLGGFFGMSGWLPFAKQLEAISESNGLNSTDGKNVAEHPEDDSEKVTKDSSTNDSNNRSSRAIHFVKENVVKIPDDGTNNDMLAVPIFLGHGELDRKVVMRLGQQAAHIMGKLGWKVAWKSYPDLDHWYCPEELEDVAKFVKDMEKDI